MTGSMPPPPSGEQSGAAQAAAENKTFSIVSGKQLGPQRVVIYGPGGVGKSTLAALAPKPVFIDIGTGTGHMDVPRVDGVETWADMLACLNGDVLDGFETVVIDDGSKAEELSIAHTIATVPHEKGNTVKRIEDYGYGKGVQHNFDTFLHLLAAGDRQLRQGRNIVLICHDCIADVPNPASENYIRFEPHLQAPKKSGNIRNKVVQWADHILFIGYDIIAKDNKATGSGSRTIWAYEVPSHHIAKSRENQISVPFKNAQDGKIWPLILEESNDDA